jgi:hypothetical protein
MKANECSHYFTDLSNNTGEKYKIKGINTVFDLKRLKVCNKEDLETAEGIEKIKMNKGKFVNVDDECELLMIYTELPEFQFHRYTFVKDDIEWI